MGSNEAVDAVGEGGGEPLFGAALVDSEALAEVADRGGEAADGEAGGANACLETGKLGAREGGVAQDAIFATRKYAE